jgi:hypothetical protein
MTPTGLRALGVFLFLLLPHRGEGAVISYFNRAAWTADLAALSFNINFQTIASDIDFFTTPSVDVGPFTIRANNTASAGLSLIDVAPFVSGFTGNGTTQAFFALNNGNSGMTADLLFDLPLRAFGMDNSLAGGAPGNGFRIQHLDAAGTIIRSVAILDSPVNVSGFFGIITTAGEQITSVHLISNGNSRMAVDNVAGVVAVPEPDSLLLFGTGGLGLIARVWRRRKQA